MLGTTVQSSAEEVLFRGWLLESIGARYRPWIGVLVSSLVFGVAHTLNPQVTPLAVLNLSLFGAFLAAYVLAEGGLWGACAWHTAWNWMQLHACGFPMGGGEQSAGLLTSIRTAGPDIITGGAFGPEAGLPTTAVLLIGIGIIAVRTHRDARNDRTREPLIAS